MDKIMIYTPEQIAKILLVTPKTIKNLLASGSLAGIRVGKLWRIPQTALDSFLITGGRTKAQQSKLMRERQSKKSEPTDDDIDPESEGEPTQEQRAILNTMRSVERMDTPTTGADGK